MLYAIMAVTMYGVWPGVSRPAVPCRSKLGHNQALRRSPTDCSLDKPNSNVSEKERQAKLRSVLSRLTAAQEQLDAAVAAEDYATAATRRDEVQLLHLSRRDLQLQAQAQEHPRALHPVGTCIKHRRYGYRGIIIGHDSECCAPEEWVQAMRVDLLPGGRRQPFYHVLVDNRDRPGGQSCYVAQENLVAMRQAQPVQHPLVPRYFQVLRQQSDDHEERRSEGGLRGSSGIWAYVPRAQLREAYRDDF